MHALPYVLAANGLSVGIKRTSAIPYSKKNITDNQHRCECHQPPQTCLNESVLSTHYADSQCLVNYKPYTYHGKGKVLRNIFPKQIKRC